MGLPLSIFNKLNVRCVGHFNVATNVYFNLISCCAQWEMFNALHGHATKTCKEQQRANEVNLKISN